MYLPLIAFPFLSLPDVTRLRLFIALVAVTSVLAVIGNNAWIAWMGDVVPAQIRGRFFGRRTVFLTLAGATSSLAAGVALDTLSPRGWKGETLAGLAAMACLAGLASIWLLRRQHEPAAASTNAGHDGWAALAACVRDRAGRPFLLYQFWWHVAVGSVANLARFPGMMEHALPTKTIGDFLYLRSHVIGMLETAAERPSAEERRQFLTFVVVGAGFAAVETASSAGVIRAEPGGLRAQHLAGRALGGVGVAGEPGAEISS